MPPGCEAANVGAPNKPAYAAVGDSGNCPVTAPGACSWQAAVIGNPNWVNLTTSSGSGHGQVAFSVGLNLGPARQATIFLVQNTSASCTITQSAALLTESERTGLTWVSDLDLAGARGQVVVDGVNATFQSRGPQQGAIDPTPGLHRVEATVVSAEDRPGTWRFQLAGPLAPGSLRVVAGTVVSSGEGALLFRLSGKAGERIVFVFRVR